MIEMIVIVDTVCVSYHHLMTLSLYALLEASLLILNAIAVLNRERFLKKIGFDAPVHSFDGNEGSVKNQIISLILAVQTVMRMPLIGINIIVVLFKLILG